MRKIICSLILTLGLCGLNAFGQVDLTVKELKFSEVTVSPGVKGYAVSAILQKNTATNVAPQMVSIRSLDAAGKPSISCDLSIPAWNSGTMFAGFPCLVGSETMKKISKIYVTADAENKIAETNEKNNLLEYSVPSALPIAPLLLSNNVMPGGGWEFLPDLKVQSWEFSPDFKKLHVTVQSVCGNADTSFVAVDFHRATDGKSPKIFSFGQVVSFVAAGSTAKITLDVAGFTEGKDVRGINFITVTADSSSLQKESDENNNFLNMGADKKIIAPTTPEIRCQKR